MIGIVVLDVATSLRFYRFLGLDIPADVETEPYLQWVPHCLGYRGVDAEYLPRVGCASGPTGYACGDHLADAVTVQ